MVKVHKLKVLSLTSVCFSLLCVRVVEIFQLLAQNVNALWLLFSILLLSVFSLILDQTMAFGYFSDALVNLTVFFLSKSIDYFIQLIFGINLPMNNYSISGFL